MATILEFRSAPRPSSASALAAQELGRSGEVVFFPGVRYEKVEEAVETICAPAVAKPKTKPKKSTRDTLDLES
jgi:hypothetical protein